LASDLGLPWPVVGYGFLLGWSVAWPPGPINAEMVRRGLARGFLPAFALGLGACSGDALWALAVVLGAGALFAGETARLALGALSSLLLLLLAFLFLRGAWRGLARRRMSATEAPEARFGGTRAGYLLGLTMALTSPWNVAFWLAVIGRPETAQQGAGTSLVLAAAVILGAMSWCVLLCSAVVLLRLRFASAAWEIAAQGGTGLLMLYFAGRSITRLSGL
jgi:threonine/homoserine/homoserine lactone efflux protein